MPGSAGTLETIARQVGLALQPLETQLTSDNIIPFLANLGLQFPPSLTAQAGFMNAANQAATAAGALDALLTQLATDITSDNEDAIVQDGLKVVGQIALIIPALERWGPNYGYRLEPGADARRRSRLCGKSGGQSAGLSTDLLSGIDRAGRGRYRESNRDWWITFRIPALPETTRIRLTSPSNFSFPDRMTCSTRLPACCRHFTDGAIRHSTACRSLPG